MTGTNPTPPAPPRMIAIGSGKGGVGKSTVTANVAVALARAGKRVGIVDADIYGPSIPRMLGISARAAPAMDLRGRVLPAEAHGVRVMSMAMLSDDDTPAILRGPMVTKYLRMFVDQVAWGDLDLLLLDLPPGTGDIQLTLAQAFPLSGAVVVTTPQDVSQKIARRGLRMLQQVNVPILGVIENMSGFTCPSCGHVTHIFHRGGGETIAADLGVPYLGRVPLDPAVVDSGDSGLPLVVTAPDSPAGVAYAAIAGALAEAGGGGAGLATPFVWDMATGTGKPAAAAPDGRPGTLVAIDRDAGALVPRWGDGHARRLAPRDLRLACPCAACRDEVSGKVLLRAATVPLDIRLTRVWSVGNYALGLAFSDGHSSGIFKLDALRGMAVAEIEDV